jgi:two-component system, LytTR family, response regulator
MRVVIIDDERLACEELKSVLKNYPNYQIVGEARNGQEGLALIESTDPDLVFCDVQMPGMTGFEMLSKLETMPRVVFVTAYDEFAIDAFKVKAIDYVLKPIDPERFRETIEKINASEEEDKQIAKSEKIRTDRRLSITDKVFIKDGEKCSFIELSKVRYFESDGNYVKVYFDKNRPLILRSLNALEERLDPEHFFRANRKFIVNMNFITNVETWFNGGLKVFLGENEIIEVSRRQAIRFKENFSL